MSVLLCLCYGRCGQYSGLHKQGLREARGRRWPQETSEAAQRQARTLHIAGDGN